MKGIAVSGFVADRERLVSQPDKTTRAKKEVIDRRTNSKCDCLRFATMVMMNFSARCGTNSIADLRERFGRYSFCRRFYDRSIINEENAVGHRLCLAFLDDHAMRFRGIGRGDTLHFKFRPLCR